ncbi:MAG: group III truncated hemoglobin [Burkholderiaceae bacterium]
MDDLSLRPDRAAIARLVERFYADVRADGLLAPVFEPLLHERWPAHLARMTDFWCTTLKLERSFRGDVHRKHMALADITPAHVQRWLHLWQRDTALELNPAAAARLQDVAVGIARVMHLGWFGRLPARDQLLEELALDASAV